MSTATLPQVEPADPGTDDVNHRWHCRPDVAYCGADLTGHAEREFADDDPAVCVLCRIADDCGHRCPACRQPVTS